MATPHWEAVWALVDSNTSGGQPQQLQGAATVVRCSFGTMYCVFYILNWQGKICGFRSVSSVSFFYVLLPSIGINLSPSFCFVALVKLCMYYILPCITSNPYIHLTIQPNFSSALKQQRWSFTSMISLVRWGVIDSWVTDVTFEDFTTYYHV